MRSSTICAAHTTMFGGLLVLSPSLSLLAVYFPALLPGRCLVYLCATGIVTTLTLWRAFGECPCTKLEREAMRREKLAPYEGPWLAHYAGKWLGIRLHPRASATIPLVLLAFPLLVGIWKW